MKVTDVKVKKILNSRKEPTIAVSVNGSAGKAPSGASKGRHEAPAFPKGIDFAVKLINSKIGKKLKGIEFKGFMDLKKIEKILPKNLGANPIVALEFALLNALANEKKKPLWKILDPNAKKMPMPLANVIGGGSHTKKNGLDVQEILILPEAKSFSQAVKINTEIYNRLGKELRNIDKKFKKEKTDEHAWITYISEPEVLELLNKIVKEFEANYKIKIRIGIDFAASRLYKNNRYIWQKLVKADGIGLFGFSRQGQIELIESLADRFNLYYLEDPLSEDDFSGFAELRRKLKGRLICGDDLTVTNPKRIKKAKGKINAIIIKPNQIGSLVKTKQAIDIAKRLGIIPIMSHRSGETDDSTISHLAFAWQVPIVKFGVAGKERLAKLNELIKIEKSI